MSILGGRAAKAGSPVRLGGMPFRYVACLKRDAFAVNHLLEEEAGGRRWVLKVARPVGWLAARERAGYRRAAGLDGVPALGPVQGERWLLHEYVEGTHIDYFTPLPRAGFYDRLEALVRALHERGLIFLDLAKRDNVLVREDGTPALIDFQISLRFARARRGPLARRLFALLARADLYQVWKHRRRHEGGRPHAEAPPEDRTRSALHRLHRSWLRDAWRAWKRRALPGWW